MQRGILDDNNTDGTFIPPPLSVSSTPMQILASSPMTNSQWKEKVIDSSSSSNGPRVAFGSDTSDDGSNNGGGGGRGRARKRLRLYNSLASYHTTFLELISEEYQLEESEVISRIEASVVDPTMLERSGHALFDIHPQRRGNLFADEVYRLEKSRDATTTFFLQSSSGGSSGSRGLPSPLPPNHNFSRNDVIVLTLQPKGTGDFLGTSSLPTNLDAIMVEARVLNVGPSYIDTAIPAGKFTTAFGPASNNIGTEGKGDPNMRVRVDRFFSDVPFRRMVAALGQLTSIPDRQQQQEGGGNPTHDTRIGGFQMDALLKEVILSTFAIKDDAAAIDNVGMSNPTTTLGELPKKLAKSPLPTSNAMADTVMAYIRSNPNNLFPQYNEPQYTAIRSALTRRLTLIQGREYVLPTIVFDLLYIFHAPALTLRSSYIRTFSFSAPGTGKTTTAGSIAFGFVHQCRSLSPHCKVLATAFSNVGADNLAEKFLSLGLKVVRVGKASGVSESLWPYTLDAAIERDPNAQKALEDAARITAKIRMSGGSSSSNDGNNNSNRRKDISAERAKRDAATDAVKASIQACNIAATRALREADVIVATSIGAADAQLLAACGIYPEEEEEDDKKKSSSTTKRRAAVDTRPKTQFGMIREFAPDNLPPLSTPFVIIDEACQSVEPASLIPIVSTNSCRALVMLGDPCQLPPTVRSDVSSTGESPLSISLMSRLASTLPPPVTITAQKDNTPLETRYLQNKATRNAVSKLLSSTPSSSNNNNNISYRKQYSGSLLLSVQYRMHPSIAAFSSAIFYSGLLSSPLKLGSSRIFPPHLSNMFPSSSNTDISVRFVQVGGRNNESRETVKSGSDMPTLSSTDTVVKSASEPSSTSYRNDAEARRVVQILTSILLQKDDETSFQGSIGIVTPYSGQVALIKSMMAKDAKLRELMTSFPHEIEVKSVDAYQGRERDLIFFSTVRSNRQGNVGFLTDWRRMNVAITRAKSGLLVVGDADTLKDGDRHWNAFVQWCEQMDCLVK
jgi:hypothetical protein